MAFIRPAARPKNSSLPVRQLLCPTKIVSPKTAVVYGKRAAFRCTSTQQQAESNSVLDSNNLHGRRSLKHYEDSLKAARDMMKQRVFFTEIMNIGDNQPLALAMLLFICCRGVRMTTPVEDWLNRAANACREQGFDETADHFREHAGEEKGHNLMYEADTRRLTARWNEIYPDYFLSADSLLAANYLTPGERAFASLHETSIASDTPFSMVPVVYEIERLATTIAPTLTKKLVDCVGDSVERDLSFLQYHMHHDIDHLHENELQLQCILNASHEHADVIVRYGIDSLQAYGDFLDDCFVLASATVADMDATMEL